MASTPPPTAAPMAIARGKEVVTSGGGGDKDVVGVNMEEEGEDLGGGGIWEGEVVMSCEEDNTIRDEEDGTGAGDEDCMGDDEDGTGTGVGDGRGRENMDDVTGTAVGIKNRLLLLKCVHGKAAVCTHLNTCMFR